MNRLIWFSIPGAILLSPFILIKPELVENNGIGLIIIGVPVIGFIIQQLSRTIFELLGGFASESRKIIKEIKEMNWATNNENAFLVWELTFYSEAIDSSFRDHDRGAWHFIMSFYSCSLASFISIFIIVFNNLNLFKYFCLSNWVTSPINWYWIAAFLILFLLFLLKAQLTRQSLENQESAMLKIREAAFWENAKKISGIK